MRGDGSDFCDIHRIGDDCRPVALCAAYALISTFIFLAFGAAVFMSGGVAKWLLLGQSVLLFNLGIAVEVIVLTLFEVFPPPSAPG